MIAAANTRVYFAGGIFPDPSDKSKPPRFDLVHASRDRRPYLTASENGLKILAGHADLYRLSEDHAGADLVQARTGAYAPKRVKLTPDQVSRVEHAIHTGYFFM